MTENILLLIIGGAIAIIGTVAGGILQHILEQRREKEERFFAAKKQAYAKVVSGISTSFFKAGDLSLNQQDFLTEMRIRMGEVFGEARLLGTKEIEEKLRNYYSCAVRLHEQNLDPSDPSSLNGELGRLGREIEEAMRLDLQIRK